MIDALPEKDLEGRVRRVILTCLDVTESRAIDVDRALRESEERFRRIVEGAPDGIFIQMQRRFAYLNPALCRLLGIASPQELIGTPVGPDPSRIPRPGRDRIRRLNEDRERVDRLLEQRYLRKDGSEVWVESVGEPIVLNGDNGAIAFVRDISKRKAAELDREKTESWFRLLAEAAPIGFAILDRDDVTHYISPRFVEIFGYTQEDVPTIREWWALAYPDPAERERARSYWESSVEEARRTGSFVGPIESPVTCRDGSIRHIEIRMAAVGELNVATLADITARKRAEESGKEAEAALRESEDRFRALVDGAPDGIFVPIGGRFGFVNAALVRLLGAHGPQELVGTDIFRRIAPEHHEIVRTRMATVTHAHQPVPPLDEEYVRMDGSRVPVETAVVAFRFQGQDAHLVFVRDGTARRIADQERGNLQAQLLQSQKMESVGRLAGGLAHDFNNILMVQKGYCEMLQRGLREEDPLAKGLAQIDGCAERAIGLTRQLLAFSRKQTLQPRSVDLNVLVARPGPDAAAG